MLSRKISMALSLIMLVCLLPLAAYAGQKEVVSLGADLTPQQKEAMLKEFGVSPKEVEIIEVTIQDVRQYLPGATREQIGTKAISSAHVKLLPAGEGISVDTHNVTLVTEEMYANALVTAGVKDAQVKVAAPFKVTGTTALTGIMKAFEAAAGVKLDDQAKQTANEELNLTQNMGQEIGQDKAVQLIRDVKQQVLQRQIKTPEDIRRVIHEVANQLGLTLSEEQVDQILALMKKISQLNLNVDSILTQLDKISYNLDIVRNTIAENKSVLQRILDAILSWLRSIFG